MNASLSIYMKFTLKTKDLTFYLIVLETYRSLGCNIGILGNDRKLSKLSKISKS